MTEVTTNIPARLKNAAVNGHVAGVEDIVDDVSGKTQQTINSEVQDDLESLRDLYQALTKNEPVIGPLPQTGEKAIIYRVPGESSYADWMWNGTQFVQMAKYDNAIDDKPTAGSANLVKSGGAYEYLAKNNNTVSSPEYTEGNYSNGVFHPEATGYGTVAPIELKPKETIFLNLGNPIYHGGNVDVLFSCDSSGNFVESLVNHGYAYDTVKETYTNKGNQTVYVGISAQKAQLGYIIEGLDEAISKNEAKADNSSLFGIIVNESNKVGASDTSYDSTICTHNGYIKSDGTIEINTGSLYSDLIRVYKGQLISLTCGTNSLNRYNMAIYHKDGTLVSAYVPQSAGTIVTFTHECTDNDCFVRVCCPNTTSFKEAFLFATSDSGIIKEVKELQSYIPEIEQHDSLLLEQAMKAEHFDSGEHTSAFQWDNALNMFPRVNDGNISYLNQKIVRVEFYAKEAGYVRLLKGTIVNGQEPVIEELQTSNVVAGFNSIVLNTPLKIQKENEYIGFYSNVMFGFNAVYSTENVYYWYQKQDQTMTYSTKEVLVNILTEKIDVDNIIKKAVPLYNPFRDCYLVEHMFVESSNPIIPSQSLWDIALAKKLGFKFIEVNVHRCSDGVFVCKHGSAGKLGSGLTFTEGSQLTADTLFADVSSTDLREQVTYNSHLVRYRGHIPTLDEFCQEANRQGMGILIGQLLNAEEPALDVARKYLPDDRIIAYQLPKRGTFKGMICVWGEGISADQCLSVAESYGPPFFYSLSNYNSLSAETLATIVDKLHKNGYLVGTAYVYGTGIKEALDAGIDSISSTMRVTPPIESGNLLNIVDTDQGLTLSPGVTFNSTDLIFEMPIDGTISISDPSYWKRIIQVSVRIIFDGTITMSIGPSDDTYYNLANCQSDGSQEIEYSQLTLLYGNILNIKAITATTIKKLSIIASVI